MASQIPGVSGLFGRYAGALFDLAERDNALDKVATDLRDLDSMIKSGEDLRRLLSSPAFSRDDQAAVLAEVAGKAGFSRLAKNFIGVVVANGRALALPNMILAFQAILAARRGAATAEVVSAKPLTEAQAAELACQLKKIVGGAVRLETKVDPSVLGGLVVKVGSRMIDTTLKTKLQQLRFAMKGVA